MKSLNTLIKLQKMHVDEQRKLLARLQARVDAVIQEIAALENQKEQEKIAMTEHPEMGQTYGDFVKKSILQGRDLERQKQTALKAVDIAHNKLTELYEEQKRYELAEEARQERELKEELHKERLILDEVGSISFTRKMKEKS